MSDDPFLNLAIYMISLLGTIGVSTGAVIMVTAEVFVGQAAGFVISAMFLYFALVPLKIEMDSSDRAWKIYEREKEKREDLEKYKSIVESLDLPSEAVDFKILENQDVEMQLE